MGRVVCNAVVLIAVAFLVMGCKKSEGIVGTWIAYPSPESIVLDSSPDERGLSWTITFNSDGTFEETIDLRIMMELRGTGKGTYEVDGSMITAQGVGNYYTDDGYSSGEHERPINWTFVREGDELRLQDEAMPYVFVREGTKPVVKSKPKPAASSKEALDLIAKVEAVYAGLETYEDKGIVTGGHGFMAEEVRFVTRFSNDGRFIFVADSYEDGKTYMTDAVWSDGDKEWFYMGMVGGTTERGTAHALSTLVANLGSLPMLVPSLLMQAEFRNEPFTSRFDSASLLEDEDGLEVLELIRDGNTMKIWVDPETYAVKRVSWPEEGETVTYEPTAGKEFSNSDFVFTPPGS